MRNRLRSKAAWMSTIALIVFVLKTYFEIEVEKADELIELLCIFGASFGIWNNPADKENF